MGITYMLGLAPVAIFMRLVGRDMLDRGLRPDRSSQWLPKEDDQPDIHRVQKQY